MRSSSLLQQITAFASSHGSSLPKLPSWPFKNETHNEKDEEFVSLSSIRSTSFLWHYHLWGVCVDLTIIPSWKKEPLASSRMSYLNSRIPVCIKQSNECSALNSALLISYMNRPGKETLSQTSLSDHRWHNRTNRNGAELDHFTHRI